MNKIEQENEIRGASRKSDLVLVQDGVWSWKDLDGLGEDLEAQGKGDIRGWKEFGEMSDGHDQG